MNVVISAHMDLARPAMFIKMDEKNLLGLVDNFAGVFASYSVSRKTGTPVYFTNYEELDYDGADAVAKSLNKDTIVFVVDTILEKDIAGKQASITNIYGLGQSHIKNLKETFKEKIHFIDGYFEQTEDETWIYGHKYGLKTFYFGIPIPGTYYHSLENQVSLKAIDEITEILIDLVEWFKML